MIPLFTFLILIPSILQRSLDNPPFHASLTKLLIDSNEIKLPYIVDLPPLLTIALNNDVNNTLSSTIYTPSFLLDLCTRPSTRSIKYTQRKRSLRLLLSASAITGRTYIQSVLQASR